MIFESNERTDGRQIKPHDRARQKESDARLTEEYANKEQRAQEEEKGRKEEEGGVK